MQVRGERLDGWLQALAGDLVGLGLEVGAAGAVCEEAGEDWLDQGAEDDLGASADDVLVFIPVGL